MGLPRAELQGARRSARTPAATTVGGDGSRVHHIHDELGDRDRADADQRAAVEEAEGHRSERTRPDQTIIKDLITGTGATAAAGKQLTVNYVGVLYKGGKEFDSSWKRNQTFPFTLGQGSAHPGLGQGPRRHEGRRPTRAHHPV